YASKCATGYARGGDLQHNLGPYSPAFADDGGIDVYSLSRQVLTECSVREVTSFYLLPAVEVFALIRIDGLIIASMIPRITNVIACKATRPLLHSWFIDIDLTLNRSLVNSGHMGRAVLRWFQLSHIDGENPRDRLFH